MEEQLIARLIEFVESASPTVWAVASKQASVIVFQDVLGLVVMSIATVACIGIGIYAKRKKEDYDDWGFVLAMSVMLGLIAFCAAFALVTDIIGRTMNPDYYAIKAMTDLLR